jgi:monofunctional biosynthetic peptidoglycan transglycosylase
MAEAAAGRVKVRKAKTGKKRRGLLASLFLLLFGVTVAFPVLWVLAYRFVPPPATSLMLIRLAEGRGLDYRWRGLKDISPTLADSVIASEDARFCLHHGFDFTAMEKAMAHNDRRPGRIRGGSTISQQTAKNVFLWPDRSYVRKGLEAYFTVLIEGLWGKKRIMEVYLNVVEMGPGYYGAEAASQIDFGHSARKMSASEAARLAAILPNPLKYNAVDPGAYVQRRAGKVAGQAGVVRRDSDLSGCIK